MFRVLIKRTGYMKQISNITILDYMDDLTRHASKFSKGLIKSQKFWQKKQINEDSNIVTICSICDWSSIQYWNDWIESNQRDEIRNKYNKIIINEEIYDLHVNSSHTDVFLL